jgi:acetyl-CoA C-acetyltransferase
VPEAVLVAAARSPIGRAVKGSLNDVRPDDLVAAMIRTALDQIPALDRHDVDDVYVGCGLPGGESGFNMARIVNVMNGMDDVPGATITRYCASSVQTTRMAFHAIKAGEGEVFVSAGVETVSRYEHGNSDSWPNTRNPTYAEAMATAPAARRGTTHGRTASSPTPTSPWARPRRTSPRCGG